MNKNSAYTNKPAKDKCIHSTLAQTSVVVVEEEVVAEEDVEILVVFRKSNNMTAARETAKETRIHRKGEVEDVEEAIPREGVVVVDIQE